ncbi:Increased dna methylation 3 [Heracleum sosnowskyi]|uniref:Increased dna methylation 3 n=1 Tax=Heracleum sosnowskyi TaxID=360622 RepID=A0AAD8HVT6_9APIA|nr:Increased dna methylation 3 [Heracleum sosnowskyi]
MANTGTVSPFLGKVNISVGDGAYNFQAALPGISTDLSGLKVSILNDGRVRIEGVVPGSSRANADVLYEEEAREFPPPGPFSIAFNLPGPVDPRLTSSKYEHGILDATVMKFRLPPDFPNGNH